MNFLSQIFFKGFTSHLQENYIKEKFFVAVSVLFGCGYFTSCYYKKVRRTMRTAIVS